MKNQKLMMVKTWMRGKPVVRKIRLPDQLSEDQFRRRNPDLLHELRRAGLTKYANGHKLVFTLKRCGASAE